MSEVARVNIYRDLAGWWSFITDRDDYEEEAAVFRGAIESSARRPVRRVLELGCGGGNNATWLKRYWDMTLTDLTPELLDVSREANPECRHLQGDMRELRLGERFDAVFVHDAVCYMTTEADLARAMTTAYVHLESGGVALFVPDYTTETYEPGANVNGDDDDDDDRAMHYLHWQHPVEPGAQTYRVSFAIVQRDGTHITPLYDEHVYGLFPRQTWLDLLASVGFEPRTLPFAHSEFSSPRELFLGLR